MALALETARQRIVGSSPVSPSVVAAQEILSWTQALSARTDLRDSVRRPGIGAPFVRGVSFGWALINVVRRSFARRGWIKHETLSARVISVGNIQVGGAGKTPLVIEIAKQELQRGKKVAVLSRGYRSQWEKSGGLIYPRQRLPLAAACGDEVLEMARALPEVWIGVGRDRVKSFVQLQQQDARPFDTVILDDGFQFHRLKKNLEIVAVTSRKWGEMLFRDFPNALKYADLVVWTKGDRLNGAARPTQVDVSMRLLPTSESAFNQARPFWLLTALADPEMLAQELEIQGLRIQRRLFLRDHAVFSDSWLSQTVAEARREGAQILTTAKDWTKLSEWAARTVPEQDSFKVLGTRWEMETGGNAWKTQLLDS